MWSLFLFRAHKKDLRERQCFAVRNGQQRSGRPHRLKAPGGAAVKPQLRRARHPNDLDIAPQNASSVPGAERLHRRLLGSESRGKVRGRIAPAGRVRDFARRKDTLEKTIAKALDRLLDAIDLGSIEAKADNVHMPLPKPSGEFEWTQEAWGPALRCSRLSPHAPHCFTTRHLALCGPADEAAASWKKVAATIGLEPQRLLRLRQVHGARVIEGAGATLETASHDEWPEADVAVSNDPTVGLAVRVADCVPLLLADRRTGAVAAVHAGWRGMAVGAPAAAVSALERRYGTRPADLVAAAGPSIGPCCYIVGPELPGQFALQPEAASWFLQGHTLRLDLWRATHDQLRRAGLEELRIHLSKLCTACHTELFCSYRKEKAGTGRLAGVIRSVYGQKREDPKEDA